MTLFVTVLLFAGCSEKSDNNEKGPIVVIPGISVRASDTLFEEGDKIGVTIVPVNNKGANIATNSQMTYTDGYFESDEGLMWYDKNTRANFIAYYPFTRMYPSQFSVKTSQNNTDEKHYTQSDLMFARTDNVPPKSAGVRMIFSHVMSLLVVEVEDEANIGIKSLLIGGTKVTADIDIENRIVTPTAGSLVADINTYRPSDNDNVFKALIVPQTAGVAITVVTKENKEVQSVLPVGPYEPGKRYSIDVTLSEGEDITHLEIKSESDIQDWEPGVVPKK